MDPDDSADILNIAFRLRETARCHPDKPAVLQPVGRKDAGGVQYRQLTFRQLDRESDRLARGLVGVGLHKGVRTILMVKPGIDFFVLTFALFKTGAVPVVVDPGMGIRRMAVCLAQSRPAAFIGIPRAHLLRLLFPTYFRSIHTWITAGRRWFAGGKTLEQIRSRQSEPFDPADTAAADTAAVLFTTGSTGPAKGAIYTHGNFDAQIRHIQFHFGIDSDEIDLPTFPLFALFDPALGMTAVIPDMDPTRPAHVNPEHIINPIRRFGITNMFASPALLNRVGTYGKANGVKLPSLRRVVSAGAPVSPANIAQFGAMLSSSAQIHTPYGATEAVPVASIGSREIMAETRQLSEAGAGMCVGRPLNGIELRIIRISDGPLGRWSPDLVLPQGQIGEIAVKGDLVTRGYFENPQADALAKIPDDDGFWHRMGDVGWQDERGRIWFCGRKSHRVVTARKTMFTIPCEAIFNNHPAVFRSALVGIGRPPEQEPVICIEMRPGHSRSSVQQLADELLQLAAGNELTRDVRRILFHRSFPVDIRHNSKIFREKLARWAQRNVKRCG